MEKKIIITITIIGTVVLLFILLLCMSYSMLQAVDNKYKAMVDKKLKESAKIRNEFMNGSHPKEYFMVIGSRVTDQKKELGLVTKLINFDCSQIIHDLDNNDECKLNYHTFAIMQGTGSLPSKINWITHDILRKHQLLYNENFLVRMASKLFRSFSVCIVDRQIRFLQQSAPKDKRNVFVAVSMDSNRKVYQLHVDDKKKTLKLNDQISIVVDKHDALAVTYGVLSVLEAAGFGKPGQS
ncbi:hypothetical protein THOM_3180 [Trachipleistophora hominis]|uniref:Uncharacterized protein n=1 Tax=Trachipleistophora hominis TaxID=72359 RepID=L7JT20_TRAHO|nr:hypothetical protein THOM_3180 [Trachipleistophora hominis]